MPDREHARLLLDIARRDLRTVEVMVAAVTVADEVFGFHAQQATEKALKAWLAFLEVDYPRIHDLDELLSLVQDHDPDAGGRFSGLTELTPFAVQFRYDLLDKGMGGIDRAAVAKDVSTLVEFVGGLLRT